MQQALVQGPYVNVVITNLNNPERPLFNNQINLLEYDVSVLSGLNEDILQITQKEGGVILYYLAIPKDFNVVISDGSLMGFNAVVYNGDISINPVSKDVKNSVKIEKSEYELYQLSWE